MSLQSSDGDVGDWLANYRARIREILRPYFSEVDFLPEPFAVFQYYRYGYRHPLLVAAQQHVALVVDFGGGTFDVSVVEATIRGDVSASGRNSRPLAAASIPVGGHEINRIIAREVLRECVQKTIPKERLNEAWTRIASVDGGEGREFSALREDLKTFARHIRRLTREIENAKVSICKTISSWSLEAEFEKPPSYPLQVPTTPFSIDGKPTTLRMDATKLRKIFVERIWKPQLKGTIDSCIDRAKDELDGKPITVVLLSGGSSNIGWLSKLIEIDFQSALAGAEIVELQDDYQEVVARGLAIECARRTYNPGQGDFKAVTYNRLCLLLGVDTAPATPPQFRAISDSLPQALDLGVLLPSASVLASYVNVPLQWEVRLTRPPKRSLDYYLMRSSFDSEDIANRQNVDHTVYTPPATTFDSKILVELSVREDGTAIAKFIYRKGFENVPRIEVQGTPFHLDMTDSSAVTIGEAYFGFDFGTSNSSISYVSQAAIRQYTQRVGDHGWQELNDLVDSLPFPVAAPLSKFLAATDKISTTKRFVAAFESMLEFAFAISYVEFTTIGRKETKLLKSLGKMSAGPLLSALRQAVSVGVKSAPMSGRLAELFNHHNEAVLNDAVAEVNDFKHDRTYGNLDYNRVLNIIGNLLAASLGGRVLGRFESVVKHGFGNKFSGYFKVARGDSRNLARWFKYEGRESFSEQEAFIVDIDAGTACSLTPILFWHTLRGEVEPTIAVLDQLTEFEQTFKTADGGHEVLLKDHPELVELRDCCVESLRGDVHRQLSTGLAFFEK